MTDTLLVDADGVYDPRCLNDRLLLGLKGTMSEFELGLFRQRAREAFEMKVRKGHAMWEMPVGMARTEDDRVEKIADRQVQAAIEGVFAKFRQLGSARQVTLWYRDQSVPLPEVVPGTRGLQVVWRLPRGLRINQILKNPVYAGALVYGRTEAKTRIEGGRARKVSTRTHKTRETWKVLILENHPGYITWKEFLDNQAMLESNISHQGATGKGAAKTGAALLAGLLRCGHCGRKMLVNYSGVGGRVPRYGCPGDRTSHGSAACQSLGGAGVERAVTGAVLEAIRPVGVQAALDTLDRIESHQDEKRKSLELALEKARYEVDRTRRQYDMVDPANRLVAGELETRWNRAMEYVTELERQIARQDDQTPQLTEEERWRLLDLGRDLRGLWDDPKASDVLKKRVLRTVVEEIVIRDDEARLNHTLAIHWKGGVHTELTVARAQTGRKANDCEKTVLSLIEELSKVCSDQATAAILNRLGYKTGGGMAWRVHSVHTARSYHRLTNHRQTGEWLTIEQAARETLVSHTVIRRLIREETLPASQVVATTPWVIARKSLALPDVQVAIAAVKQGRQLPKKDGQQAEFPM